MARFLLAGAVCLLSCQTAQAAPPAAQSPAAPNPVGRERIEALLQSPAHLDLELAKPTVSVGTLLSVLNDKSGLSIRFDIPAFANAYEFDMAGDDPALASRHSPRANWIARMLGGRAGEAPLARLTLNASAKSPIQRSTFYAPFANDYTHPVATGPVHVIVAGPAAGRSATPPAAHQKLNNAQDFVEHIEKIQVPIGLVDTNNITVATALRLALDAIPDGDAEDSDGLPLAISEATRPDFLVEGDGILITTRIKALTTKEPRVYSLKNLHNIDPNELSAVIRQSVRPWSWRSRIDELGEQLQNSALELPSKKLAPLAVSELNLATGAAGIEFAASSIKNKQNVSDDTEQAIIVGKALASGLVTLAQASLNAAEVIHYADPPTGSIRVIGNKLVVTQSQAAHREIATLLTQLSRE